MMVIPNFLLPKMPKIVPALTVTQIKNAKPTNKPVTVFDGTETGLHLYIQSSGTKTFRLKVKINNTDRRITLGTFPDLTLADARDQAAKLKKLVRQGIDPTADIKPVIENTFEVVAEKFIQWKETVVKRAGATIKKYRECLNNDLLPTLGNKDIVSIHAADVVPLLEKIEKRSNSLARKNQELISMIVKYAIQRGYRPPYTQVDLSGIIIRKPSKPKRIPNSTQVAFQKIDEYPEEVMRFAMKLQFFGYLRSSETMGAEWIEFDFKQKEWHIPKERMKMNRPHIVPLSTHVLEMLDELRKLTGNTPFLFPSAHNPKAMGRDTLSKAFRTCELGLTPHGCRTVASTWQRNKGYAPHLAESQLSHIEENDVAAAYIDRPHMMYLEERHPMMQAWSNYLMIKTNV